MAYSPTLPVYDPLYAEEGLANWRERVYLLDATIGHVIDGLRTGAPPGRDIAVAITKLQEAQMWLAKSLCVDDDAHTDEKPVG